MFHFERHKLVVNVYQARKTNTCRRCFLNVASSTHLVLLPALPPLPMEMLLQLTMNPLMEFRLTMNMLQIVCALIQVFVLSGTPPLTSDCCFREDVVVFG